MTLPELCEPVFQQICRLNRTARKGGADRLQFPAVRAQLWDLFRAMRMRVQGEPALARQYQRIEPALMVFVDEMVRTSPVSFARDWEPLQPDGPANDADRDQPFWAALDEALADNTDGGMQRLIVLATALSLGFCGRYADQPQVLQSEVRKCQTRLRGLNQPLDNTRICPEAYEHVDTTDLVRPAGRRVGGVAIVFTCLLATLAIGNVVAYRQSVEQLSLALEQLHDADSSTPPAGK